MAAVGYLFLAVVAFSILAYIWDMFTALPRAVIWAVVIGLIALVALVIALKVKKKKKAQAAEQAEREAAEQAAKEAAEQAARKAAARPPMPKASVRVVSSHDDDDDNLGMYDYEYDDIGVYRPKGLDLPLPPIGAQIEFENDPMNEYDDKAIKAVWDGQTVGWLYRKGKREMIRDWIDRGDYYIAEVTENDPELKFWIGMDRE